MTTGGGVDTADTADHDQQSAGRHVVTAFLRNAGELLLLKRSDGVGTAPGLWDGVSGDAEGDLDAAARRAVDEVTDLGGAATLVRRGDPVEFTDDGGVERVVHPFLFDCDRRAVDPNEAGRESQWLPATEILRRETTPALWAAYDRVRPTVDSVAADTDHGSAWLSLRALEVLRDEAGMRAVDGAGTTEAKGWKAVVDVAEALLTARPSMTALGNRVNRAMNDADGTAEGVEDAAKHGIERAVDADGAAAATAADRVAGETVLTLSRSGTVERALRQGMGPAHVYVAESRPAREGVGVAERLARQGRDVTLVTDAAVAHVLATEGVDRVVVGADTVLPDGSVVNKTGTRGAALAAAAEGVPVDVVAAVDKIAPGERVVAESGPATELYDGEAPVTVLNPTFDRTPPTAVSAVVTDRGVLDTDEVESVAAEFRALTAWQEG